MKKPEITVCITAYNSKEFLLRKSIESVLNQTFSDFELIIFNDGSTNNTKDIILSYKDERIKYLENQTSSGGPANPRNISLKNALGKYILFQDHDDYLSKKDALEKIHSLCEANNLDILIFSYTVLTPRSPVIMSASKSKFNIKETGVINIKNNELKHLILELGAFSIWNKLFNVQFLKDNNIFFNESRKRLEDLEIFVKYMDVAKRVQVLNEDLYVYLNEKDSLTHYNSWDIEEAKDLQVFDEVRVFLDKHNFYDDLSLKIEYINLKLIIFRLYWSKINTKYRTEIEEILINDLKKDNLDFNQIEQLSKPNNNFYKCLFKL